MPLELFFDLVFVLAITQCTTLMSHDPTWGRIGEGMLVLALLWWSWVGYSWLTSVFDPEEGAIRIVLFCAMAAFLIAAICVPEAFGGLATEFADRLQRGPSRPHRPLPARQPRRPGLPPLRARARRGHRRSAWPC